MVTSIEEDDEVIQRINALICSSASKERIKKGLMKDHLLQKLIVLSKKIQEGTDGR